MNETEKFLCNLNEMFSEGNGLNIFQLKNSTAFIIQESMSVSNYFTNWKDYGMNYRIARWLLCIPVVLLRLYPHNNNIWCSFLMGLHETYASLRRQILQMDPFPNVNKVFSLVVQEENQITSTTILFIELNQQP